MTEELNLIIGKPVLGDSDKKTKGNIATFTRFTLPFAFQLQAAPEITEPPKLFYTVNDKTDLSFIKRRKYFTRETADSLYKRAQWLSICDNWQQTPWGKTGVDVILRNQVFKIGMHPPQLVLFESPEFEPQKEARVLQTGFLYVDVYFCEGQANHPQLDDLLVFNEYFRYFGIPYDSHADIFQKIFSNIPVDSNGNVTIGELGKLECYFERWAALLEMPVQVNGQYYRLFPQTWSKSAREWMYNTATDSQAEHWQIYADNRCYVWTAAFLEGGGQRLQSCFGPDKTTLNAADYGHWIKLLNVDTPPFDIKNQKYTTPANTHIATTEFERQWAASRTYKRWQEAGTWYGFCYHGTAILAHPVDYIFAPSSTYYFDTTLLLLYIRMILFRFGRALSGIMSDIEEQNESRVREELQGLRRLFSRFTVLHRFPMLSNQQQHIEMYEISRKFHDIDQFFDETQKEVDNTHEFLETVEANRLATAANQLANWGIPIAACGLVAALFSMVDLKIWQCFSQNCTANANQVFQIVIVIVIGLFIGLILPRLLNSKTKK